MEGKPSIFYLIHAVAGMRPHTHSHVSSSSYAHSHDVSVTHAWPRMPAWLCTHIHSHCSKPIIQSESVHKFSSLVAACPVKVRALFLSKPAVWQIPASSICICAQASTFSSSCFSLHLLVLRIYILCFLGFQSFSLLLFFLSFIHSSPHFVLIPHFKFSSISLCAFLPSRLFAFSAFFLFGSVTSQLLLTVSSRSLLIVSVFPLSLSLSVMLLFSGQHARPVKSRFITNDETEKHVWAAFKWNFP